MKGAGYVFDFRPQTMVPPGFPFLLALMIVVIGSKYVVLVRSMAVFFTLALIVTYEVLRSEEGRGVAAASMPAARVFSGSLSILNPPRVLGYAVFLHQHDTSLVDDTDRLGRRRDQETDNLVVAFWRPDGGLSTHEVDRNCIGWRNSGVDHDLGIQGEGKGQAPHQDLPSLGGGGSGCTGSLDDWAARHQFAEWPAHGYQENYLAQLKLKSGNDPELGMATWRDALLRPVYNADDRAAALVGLLTHKQMAAAWYSPGTLFPLGLVLLGLGFSFWRSGGGLLEWYFVSYEALFMFWPWDFELRFILPVVPLSCLYMWRGGAVLWGLIQEKPRRLGIFLLGLAAFGILGSITWGRHVEHPLARNCVAIWGLVAFAAIGLSYGGADLVQRVSRGLNRKMFAAGENRPLWQVFGMGMVVILTALGVAMQVKIGLANYRFDLKADGSYPNIEAAEWIRSHTAPSAIVMARKEDLVFHYGERKVIWFPPSRDPKVLMEGIRKYNVRYVVVDEEDTYWRPGVPQCFKELSRAYPGEFQLVHQGPHNRIFFVEGTDQGMPNS